MSSTNFPRQKLSYKQKTKKWRKEVLDWADNRSALFDNAVRKSLYNKKINYDLVDGKLHKDDMMLVLNPNQEESEFVPSSIQHYPIINNPINSLVGEESRRRFDYKVVVSNPNAVSDIERRKKEMLTSSIEDLIKDDSISEEEFEVEAKKISDYINYEWQDLRELRANYLLNHYIKELDVKLKWNSGMQDVLIVGEEIYQNDIIQNEPTFERLNPKNVFAMGMGYSGRFEDSDIVIIEDYWNVGRVIDAYFDSLKSKDIEYLESALKQTSRTDEMDNLDERHNFIKAEDVVGDGLIINDMIFTAGTQGFVAGDYFDGNGNVRVLKVYWKSKRRVARLKRYDEETGETIIDFMPEDYVPVKEMGEEVTYQWINEAWEGIKIGEDIYVNMRPRPIQYARLENPSRCHFGIIGSIHNVNDNKAVSLVDRMKPYQYMYNVLKDRLNKSIARNLGRIAQLDLARIPEDWDVKTWLWYAKKDGIAVVDSFKEGNYGTATGKLAGNFNNSGSVLDLETGNYIQSHIALLQYIEDEMERASGISKQRQGQVSNRETVGGVERAISQSSYVTERIFLMHDNVKKRTLECLLETAKIALRGTSKKLRYIADDNAVRMLEIDGDEFAEMDYGILVDQDNSNVELEQKLDNLAHAALQNQMLSFSTIMDIYMNPSLSSIRRNIERDEKQMKENQAKESQADREATMQAAQISQQTEQAKMELEERKNIRDNEYKLLIEKLRSGNEDASIEMEKLALQEEKLRSETELKKKQLEETTRHNKATEKSGNNTK